MVQANKRGDRSTVRATITAAVVTTLLITGLSTGFAATGTDATKDTRAHQQHVLATFPFEHRIQFKRAQKGFIATLDDLKIKAPSGRIIYNGEQFGFLEGKAPPTVNPLLWRQAKLVANNTGLYKVTDGIYQIRSFDLATMTLIDGDTGWIVVDPLTSAATAAAGLALANQELGKRPVSAVVITHSHIDHFGGIFGVVTRKQVISGEVPVIAPKGFVAAAVSENLLLGPVMSRRAEYMFGYWLPAGPKGYVTSSLGTAVSTGSHGLVRPTITIGPGITRKTIDGVEFVFKSTPGAEAPVEFIFYLPEHDALHMAEITAMTMHNTYTLRGAKPRNALAWARYINFALQKWGNQADVLLQSHHWPVWGTEQIREFLAKQRDMYKYLHDQTVRLANLGYTMREIANMVKMPESLSDELYLRQLYGTVSHNVRGIYTYYLGWFSGNPAKLNPLPPEKASKKYVDFMGGPEAVLRKARESFEDGEYRWTAQVLNHLVFAYPENEKAQDLLADTLEQLGYQAESAVWRNYYLTGAYELRHGIHKRPADPGLSNLVLAADMQTVFEALAVHVNPEKAAGMHRRVNFHFTDTGQRWLVELHRSVLHGYKGRWSEKAPLTITVPSFAFKKMLAGLVTREELVDQGKMKIEGKLSEWLAITKTFDSFDKPFNIVMP